MPVQFPPIPQERFFRQARMVDVVDGDTLDIVIDMGWSLKLKERIRLEYVNTPETKGEEREAGLWVTERVKEYLPTDTPLIITSMAYDRSGRIRGKFGRTIALVYHAEKEWCLNELLLSKKLAWETDDNGSLVPERLLALLTGLPKELR